MARTPSPHAPRVRAINRSGAEPRHHDRGIPRRHPFGAFKSSAADINVRLMGPLPPHRHPPACVGTTPANAERDESIACGWQCRCDHRADRARPAISVVKVLSPDLEDRAATSIGAGLRRLRRGGAAMKIALPDRAFTGSSLISIACAARPCRMAMSSAPWPMAPR